MWDSFSTKVASKKVHASLYLEKFMVSPTTASHICSIKYHITVKKREKEREIARLIS